MKRIFVLVLFVAGLIFPSNSYAFLYDVTDIAGYGGTSGLSINELGNIAGTTANSDFGNNRAFFYDGVMHDIGTFGGTISLGYGLNDLNQVVGVARAEYNKIFPFFYDGVIQKLNIGRLDQFSPFDINNQGIIVGAGTDQFYHSDVRAYRLADGVATDLGTYRDFSQANAINESGQIVGTTTTTGDPVSRAFIYENGHMSLLPSGYVATDINESGNISYNSYGSLFYNHAINDLGQIVGTSNEQAFLSGSNLNDYIDPDLGWILTVAEDINNKGQIVGWGEYQGVKRIFLLNHTVPEPATMLLFGSGLLGAFVRRRRRS